MAWEMYTYTHTTANRCSELSEKGLNSFKNVLGKFKKNQI